MIEEDPSKFTAAVAALTVSVPTKKEEKKEAFESEDEGVGLSQDVRTLLELEPSVLVWSHQDSELCLHIPVFFSI